MQAPSLDLDSDATSGGTMTNVIECVEIEVVVRQRVNMNPHGKPGHVVVRYTGLAAKRKRDHIAERMQDHARAVLEEMFGPDNEIKP